MVFGQLKIVYVTKVQSWWPFKKKKEKKKVRPNMVWLICDSLILKLTISKLFFFLILTVIKISKQMLKWDKLFQFAKGTRQLPNHEVSYHTCCCDQMSMFQLVCAFEGLPSCPIQQMEQRPMYCTHLSRLQSSENEKMDASLAMHTNMQPDPWVWNEDQNPMSQSILKAGLVDCKDALIIYMKSICVCFD